MGPWQASGLPWPPLFIHPGRMGEVLPMPKVGDVFADVRGGGRTMRVSYHRDQRSVVVSLWVGTVCRASFRMAAGDVSTLMSTLSEIHLSLESATTGPPPGGWRPEDLGSEATGVAAAPDSAEPPVEQTGDITGTATRSLLPSAPVLRVA